MLRQPPKLSYNGLTVIMSNPSRHDGKFLMDGVAGYFFNNECLSPETNRYCCDIKLFADPSELLPNTKCVLLLGQRALGALADTSSHLSDLRGSPLLIDGIYHIPSYPAQECVDIVNHEKRHNEGASQEAVNTDKPDDYDKASSSTRRANYRFWLKQDVKKALRIIANDGKLPERPFEPEYVIYPSLSEVVDLLENTKGEDLFIDIETDFKTLDMRCFAFCFSGPKIYVVPTLDIHYNQCYGEQWRLIKALSIAFRDNTVVAHNGAAFDYFVLGYKYGIPIGRKVYDTLLAQHRIFPDVEKSLAHCTSLWTYEKYHKSEAGHGYNSQSQAEDLYRYCGKDVFTMALIKRAQLEFAKTIPGLMESIEQAQKSIRPLLTMTFTGMNYAEDMRQDWLQRNDALIMQYMRIISVLTGPKVPALISSKKCKNYFNTMLGYPVLNVSIKTKEPKYDEETLLKLKLKHHNPVIDFLLAYRRRQKESGTLKFEPWITKQ